MGSSLCRQRGGGEGWPRDFGVSLGLRNAAEELSPSQDRGDGAKSRESRPKIGGTIPLIIFTSE